MFGGRDCPLFRNKFPLVQRLRVHYPFLLDIIHQIEAKVLVRRENKVLIYISTQENLRKAGVEKSPNQSFLFI